MKAAILVRDAAAAHGRFEVADGVTDPTPGPEDIVIRLAAASINPIETMMRDGYGDALFKWMRSRGPQVLGLDGAGIVHAVGSRVRHLRQGDRVMATNWPYKAGFYAQLVQVPAAFAIKLPDTVRLLDAAAIPYAGLTAYAALRAAGINAGNAAGKRVLVHGGSGGVGSLIVQRLHRWGCWVASTCGTANVERVRALGVDRVVDYRNEDFTQVLSGLDLVVNTVAPDLASKRLNEAPHLSVLKRGGHYVSLISPTLTLADMLGAPLGLLASATWMGSAHAYWRLRGKHHHWIYFKPEQQRLADLATWLGAGDVTPLISGHYRLETLNEAHDRLAGGQAGGKLLVVLDEALVEADA